MTAPRETAGAHTPVADMTRPWPSVIDRASCPRCTLAATRVEAAGLRVSPGAWHDTDKCCAFSVEHCGPATYGHPRFTAVERAS